MAGKITSIAGGKMEFTAKKIRMESTQDSIRLQSAKDTVFNAKGKLNYDTYVPNSGATHNIVRGYWTDTQDQPITEALVGDTVRFHIETRGIPNGAFIWFGLYDDDRLLNGEEDGEDDHYRLVHENTGKGYFREAVYSGKAVITAKLNHLEGAVAADPDRMLELYYRVSYGRQNIDLPQSTSDYLKLIALPLVIDRYKLPGLNADATDIAHDMAYGYGVKHNGPIYSGAEVAAYLADYTQRGWNTEQDFLFANMDASPQAAINPVLLEEVVIRPNPIVADETRVAPPFIFDLQSAPEKAKYSRAEILSHRSWLMHLSESAPASALEIDFRLLKAGMVWGALSSTLDAMIDKFFRKEGGIFEDSALTASVAANPSTNRYCDLIADYIAEHLKMKAGSLLGLEQRSPDYGNEEVLEGTRAAKKFKTPLFTYNREGNLLAGRTLALNDIWATEVILKSYKKEAENYEITYEVTLWDHFGIDPPDMDAFYSYGAGFRAWFLLQHLHGYKPFLTKMTFERSFSGNLSRGRAERVAERQALMDAEKAREERWERLREIGRKKPGEF